MLEKDQLKRQLRFKDDNGNDFADWEVKTLGEVAEIIGGGTPETIKKKYWNGNIQWFTPTEIKSDYVSKSLRTITELGLQKSSAKILPIGTILLTTRATIGEVAIALEECTTNQGFQSLVVKNNNNNIFIFNWIKENRYELMKRANGSTFPEISKSAIEKIPISIPCPEEQTKIANFLSSIDEKIEKMEQELAELKSYKKGVMQQIFSQELRFKDENGNEFPKWQVIKLSEVGKFYAGGDLDKLEYSKSKTDEYRYPIYANGMGEGIYGYATTFQYKTNCVTVSGRGNLGLANVRKQNFNAIVRLIVIEPKDFINCKFLEETINQIKFAIESTGVPQLTVPQIKTYKIPLPSLKEQEKTANFLGTIDDKISRTQAQIEQTQQYKKGLLQNMFV